MDFEYVSEVDKLDVIIKAQTGKVYTSQAGGYACHQPGVEGERLYLEYNQLKEKGAELEKNLGHYFTSGEWSGWCDGGIGETDAIWLDALFEKFELNWKVDRNNLNKCQEAWLHIIFEGKPAILTWGNSD